MSRKIGRLRCCRWPPTNLRVICSIGHSSYRRDHSDRPDSARQKSPVFCQSWRLVLNTFRTSRLTKYWRWLLSSWVELGWVGWRVGRCDHRLLVQQDVACWHCALVAADFHSRRLSSRGVWHSVKPCFYCAIYNKQNKQISMSIPCRCRVSDSNRGRE